MVQTHVETARLLPVSVANGAGAEPLPSALLDLEMFNGTPLVQYPYDFVIVPDFIRPDCLKEIYADFPSVEVSGSFPPGALTIRGRFRDLLEELQSDSFQKAIERKFEIDLAGRPKLMTIRGHAREKDGAIHTDSATKLISVLLYMNEDWTAEGGRLRLLKSRSFDESVAEISPLGGTLVAFRRSAVSWHGHRPHAGPRRVIQLNWMSSEKVAARERGRHLAAATFKKLSRLFSREKR
jgi:hypothetical protein